MKNKTIDRANKIFGIILALVILLVLPGKTIQAQQTLSESVRVGVLAKRGVERCQEKWQSTAEYLTNEIPGYSFEIEPLGFDEINQAVEKGEIDFVLANSVFYVELEYNYGASRIATLNNLRMGRGYTIFGGVIFCRADRKDLRHLNDLKGKTFMAVDEGSFGGWLMAWRELKEHGIDPYKDFTDLSFGGTHDAVVYAVQEGRVDAGAVQTDVLERMEAEGEINLEDHYVFHEHSGDKVCLPFAHSTRGYPEWPFAKAKQTSDELAKKVAVALLEMSPDDPAAKAARCVGWTIPHNYQPVHECLKYLRVGPYKDYGQVTLRDVFRQYWPWLLGAVIIMIIIAVFVFRIVRLSQRLQESISAKKKELVQRKQAEEALRESEARYRTIIDGSAQGILVADIETKRIRYANVTICRMLGYTEEEMTRLAVIDIHPKESMEQAISEFEAQIRGDKYLSLEIPCLRRDGKIIYTDISTTKATIGGRECNVGFFTDITERKQAEEALLESEQRFRRLFDDAPLSYQSLDNDSCFIDVNNTWCRTLGYTREEVLGRHFSEFIHPDDREVFAENFPKFKKDGEISGIMFEMVRKDKSNITASFEGRVSHNSDGSFKQTHSILVDVTERELLIRQMNKRMKELRCLYLMAESISTRSTIEDIFYDIVMTIPYGFKHPLIARARIRYDDEEYICKQLDETEWRLASDLMVNGEKRGSLEVYYLEQQPEMEDWPFLQEEHKLVDAIAKTLSRTIERTLAEADIKTKVKELEEFNSLSVGRELRMIELKREINQLLDKSGSTNKYEIVS